MESITKSSYRALSTDLVSLSVYNVGFEKCVSLHQWGPGIRDHFLIHYVKSGKGIYEVNNTIYHISAGDTFIVYPNTEVRYQADKESPWEYSWIGFTGSDAYNILKATDFSTDKPVIKNISDGEAIELLIQNIYNHRGNELEHALQMSGLLYSLLSIFVKNVSVSSISNPTDVYVKKATEYICANYSYQISINDIAAYVGVSRSHLFRAFESMLNISPKEFLTDYRIKQACYLLEHTNLSITAIANSIGFDNGLYFSKAFKKYKGVSPKEYRNLNLIMNLS